MQIQILLSATEAKAEVQTLDSAASGSIAPE
jgi:hypothetical protein